MAISLPDAAARFKQRRGAVPGGAEEEEDCDQEEDEKHDQD
jgi:hypothetical protein